MRIRPHFVLFGLLAVFSGVVAAAASAETDPERSGESIVIDRLEWALSTNGSNIKWPEAVDYCAELSLAGHEDWRLPTLDELEALHDPDAEGGEGIRSPFVIGDCCLWSGQSLIELPAADGDEIAGRPEMYHWGFMFDGGLRYYAVHIFEDGRALCTRNAGSDPE